MYTSGGGLININALVRNAWKSRGILLALESGHPEYVDRLAFVNCGPVV